MGPESIETFPERDTEEKSFSLLYFIREWSEIFVVIGVFAGTAIYVTQFTPDPISQSGRTYTFGFFGSLIIVVLMFCLLFLELSKEFGGVAKLFSSTLEPENWDLAVFFVGMGLLLFSVLSVMASRGTAIFWFTRMFSLVLGFWLLSWVSNRLEGILEVTVGSSPLLRQLARPVGYYLLFRGSEVVSKRYRKTPEWSSSKFGLLEQGNFFLAAIGEIAWATMVIFGIVAFGTGIIAFSAIVEWIHGDS